MSLSLTNLINVCGLRMDKLFNHYLKETQSPASTLQTAMAYSVFNGGKRIRPLMVYAAAEAFEANLDEADAPACAIELIHSYSLIHDDLPSMDNSDLRRGKPTCHKVFSEAMAILAGDALQTLSFSILSTHPSSLSAEQRISMVKTLSEASGLLGMAGGQALDIESINKQLTIEELMQIYQLKTGALISASIKLGILAAAQPDPQIQVSIEKYADYLGLAFQIQDDLLDIESDTILLGKPQGLDSINNKITYPSIIGVEKTRQLIEELTELAMQSLLPLKDKGTTLKEIADLLLKRRQ